ncbi:hypothetical protein [Leuconostoc citreum]|nr:hypothetical protein [Leuconostoc citreum]
MAKKSPWLFIVMTSGNINHTHNVIADYHNEYENNNQFQSENI